MSEQPKPRQRRGRWLAPGARVGQGTGYIARPLRPLPDHIEPDDLAQEADKVREATRYCDEPETITDRAILDPYGKDARHFSALRHAAEVEQAHERRKDISPENRLLDIRRRAKTKRINLTHHIHKIDKALTRARNAGREPAPTTLEQIAQLEAQLDGPVDIAA